METTQKSKSKNVSKNIRPAFTPEEKEDQLIYLAVNLAEEQLRQGKASSQVITHFLKLASTKEKLEREKLELEKKLLAAKTEAYQSARETEEMYSQAIAALKEYKGEIDSDD